MVWGPGQWPPGMPLPDLLFPQLCQEGQQLIEEKPELAEAVKKKLGEIRQCWAELESTTQAKARQLLEATKADHLVQSYADLDKRLLRMESQLQAVDSGPDLASVNCSLKKLQVSRGVGGAASVMPRLTASRTPRTGRGRETP